MFILLSIFSDWSLLALRLVFGILFVAHGWPKIKNLKTTAANFSAMGFRPGVFWGTAVAFVEFFGGLAMLGGFYVQAVALLFTLQFSVITAWKIIKRSPLVGGLELDLLILAASLVLLTFGGGMLSLGRLIFPGGF